MIEVDGWLHACESAHCVRVKFDRLNSKVLVGSTRENLVLTFDFDEWKAFTDAAMDGDFDL